MIVDYIVREPKYSLLAATGRRCTAAGLVSLHTRTHSAADTLPYSLAIRCQWFVCVYTATTRFFNGFGFTAMLLISTCRS